MKPKELKIKQIIVFTDKIDAPIDGVVFPLSDISVPHLMPMQMMGNVEPNASAFVWHCFDGSQPVKKGGMPNAIEGEKIVLEVTTDKTILDEIFKAVTDDEEDDDDEDDYIGADQIVPRPITDKEKKLIFDYIVSEVKKSDGVLPPTFEEFEKTSSLTVFDFNPNFQVVVENHGSILKYANGKKKIETTSFSFAIKYDLVFPYLDDDSKNVFNGISDDFEDDISEITSLL